MLIDMLILKRFL
ncbi:hypothetical protein YPPY15_1737, partial [Yersinia pestis PY-15]